MRTRGKIHRMPRRLGILGGTFDPVHIGHLRIAEEALEELELERVLFVPSATPPHKFGKDISPFEHRVAMLQLCVQENPRFSICELEGRLSGKSYSVITLRALREEFGEDTELHFMVGLDAFLELNTWWHYQELFQLAHLLVLQRPGHGEDLIGPFLKEKISPLYAGDAVSGMFTHPHFLPVRCMRNTCLGISSTQIRQRVKEGKSIRYLVLPEVLRYIEAEKLFTV